MAAFTGCPAKCCGFQAVIWRRHGLPRVLQPTLSRLAAQTGESFSAVVRDADEVVIVAKSNKLSQNHYENNSVFRQ